MFEIRDLNHVNLVVKDLAAAKRFYCGALEMTDLPRPADLEVRGAWLRSQSAEIHLIVEAYATHAPGTFPMPSPNSRGLTSVRLATSRW